MMDDRGGQMLDRCREGSGNILSLPLSPSLSSDSRYVALAGLELTR